MGSDRTSEKGGYLTGFIVPMDSWAFWEDESTITWQSPYPGRCVPARSTTQTVIASGTPDNSDTLELRATEGGLPGSFLSRVATTVWRGWEPPNVLASIELVDTTDGTSCSIAALPSGVVLLAIERDGGSNARSVVVYVRAVDGTWDGGTTVATATAPGSSSFMLPKLLTEADGTVALYVVAWAGAGAAIATVAKWVTLDSGTSWERSALRGGFELSVTALEVSGLEVATSGDQWSMMLTQNTGSGASYTVRQYASIDGVTWEQVGTVTTDGKCLDLVYHDGFFVGLFVYDTSTDNNDIFAYRYGSAYSVMSEDTYGALLSVQGDATWPIGGLCVEDSGRIWAYFEATGTTGNIHACHSDDGGSTWIPTFAGGAPTEPQLMLDASFTVTDIRVCHARGMGLAVFEVPSSNGPLVVHTLGGWSTTANPYGGSDYTTGGNYPDGTVKYPYGWQMYNDNPEASPALSSGHTGTPTVAGGSVNGAATDVASWSLTSPSSTVRDHCYVLFRMDPSGSATGTRTVLTADLQTSTGVSYAVSVTHQVGGNLSSADVASAGSLGSATAPTTEFEVKIAVEEGLASVWYRLITGGSEDRVWTELVDGGTLTDNASSATDVTLTVDSATAAAWDTELKFWVFNLGYRSDAAGTATSIAYEGQGQGITSTYSNVGPKSFSTRPVYMNDGVSVRARGIPRRNDSWTITPGAVYHPSNALVNTRPSPRHPWKSNGTASRVLAFKRTAGVVHTDHSLIGVYFNECNFRSCTVEVYSASKTWDTVGTHNAYLTLVSGTTSTDGYSVVPVTSGTTGSAPYFRENQLAGCWLYNGATFYEIAGNTAGTWDDGTPDEKRCTIFLASPAAASATITCEVVFRRSLLLFSPSAYHSEWQGLRFTFSATTPESNIEAGNIVMDDVMVFGAGPDTKRSLVYEVMEVMDETEDGHVYLDGSKPGRRRVELTWARTIPLVNNEDADPDYVEANTHSNYGPSGDYFAAPLELQALVERVKRKPIVYVPRIPVQSSSGAFVSIVKDNAGGAFLGRFVPDSLRLETVTGHAATADEIVRVSTVTLREVV